MKPRELILLNPYSYPGQNSLVLANEDMACWMNGYTALWHPAALWQALKPPRCDVPYDYENPQAGHVYAVPEAPTIILPDDWDQRVEAAGAVAFRATTDRHKTLDNLVAALKAAAAAPPPAEGTDQAGQNSTNDNVTPPTAEQLQRLLDLPAEQVTPFFGLGLGHQLLASLSEAMEHENLLEHEAFWDDVQTAVAALGGFPYTPKQAPGPGATSNYASDYNDYSSPPGAEEFREDANYPENVQPTGIEEFASEQNEPSSADQGEQNPIGSASVQADEPPAAAQESSAIPPADAWFNHLQSAAQRLVSARDVLYPVTIHLLDLHVLDESKLAEPWPASFGHNLNANVIACGAMLEKLSRDHADKFADLRKRVEADQVEVCGGSYLEREEPLLPVDSQLWNLLTGQAVTRELLGKEVQVYARRRFAFHPQTPLFLTGTGMTRAVMLSFDEAAAGPTYSGCTVNWPSPDGKQVDAFVRPPYAVDKPETFFNLGHYLFKTTREDQTATLAFVHQANAAAPWYHDMLELARLGPVMGQWTTFSSYFGTVMAGEHTPSLSPDEFHTDFLSERVNAHLPGPVSDFARHVRLRRRLDTCFTLAGIYRGLVGSKDALRPEKELVALEDRLERTFISPVPIPAPPASYDQAAEPKPPERHAPMTVPAGMEGPESLAAVVEQIGEWEKRIAGALLERLQARAEADRPGYMILNPCSFTRRVALELDGATAPLPIADPVKACQLDGGKLRVVVEVPPLGFSWIPRSGPPGTPPPPMRMRLADQNMVRNEFFEVEIDPTTGGMRAIRDRKTNLNRLAQRLVFNPGSTMQMTNMQVTSAGPALGEIVTEGSIVGDQKQVLARFKQRYRAWLGRPMLDLRIEIQPEQPAAGYAWHAYFGCRFAWRDERGALLRGVNGMGYLTTHLRPQTPEYVELRMARQGTVIFPGGLPFHQRQEGRMLDVILMPEGEKATTFDLGIALDREQPTQTALGFVTPAPVIATSKGPPHIGAMGWLFHLDTPNLLLSRLHPGGLELPVSSDDAPRDLSDAVTARLLECAGQSGQAEFRCVRNPTRAVILNARGNTLIETSASGDAVFFEVTPGDLVQVQMEFS